MNNISVSELVGLSTIALFGSLNHVINAKAWGLNCSLKTVATYGVIETLAFNIFSPIMARRVEEQLESHVGQGKFIQITDENKLFLNVGLGLAVAKILSIFIGKLIASKAGQNITNSQVKKLALWQLIDIGLICYYYYQNQSHDSIPIDDP